jgi:hypothetical protein
MKKEGYRRKTIFEKKTSSLIRVRLSCRVMGRPTGSTGVLLGCCIGRSFNKPGPVQPPDRLTHWAVWVL